MYHYWNIQCASQLVYGPGVIKMAMSQKNLFDLPASCINMIEQSHGLCPWIDDKTTPGFIIDIKITMRSEYAFDNNIFYHYQSPM